MCSLVSLLRRAEILEGGGKVLEYRQGYRAFNEHRGLSIWTDILLRLVRAYRTKNCFVKRTALMSRYRSTSLRADGSVSSSWKRQSRIVEQVGSKLVSRYLLRSLQSRTRRSGRIVQAEGDFG